MASKQNKRFCLSPNKRALPVSSIPRGALCPNATSQTRKKSASLPQKPSAVSWILKKSARNVFDLRRLRQTRLVLQFVFSLLFKVNFSSSRFEYPCPRRHRHRCRRGYLCSWYFRLSFKVNCSCYRQCRICV